MKLKYSQVEVEGVSVDTVLAAILSEFADLHGDGDFEVAHSRADMLLLDALMTCGKNYGPNIADKVEVICDSFRDLAKWYA